MIVKEDKAQNYTCPLGLIGLSKSIFTDNAVECQGSKCMLWSWWDRDKGLGHCGFNNKVEGIDSIDALKEG